MCQPKDCGIDEIGAFGTDEEIIVYLESIQNRCPEASLPHNVVAGVNPYLHQPANISESIWYVVHSEDPRQTEVGYWKAKGDPCQICSESSVGVKTTLEFYEGQSPNGNQTAWVMQEYSLSQKGSDKEVGTSLCRVFLSDRQGEIHKLDQPNDNTRGENNDESNKSGSGTSLMSKVQEKEMERYHVMPSHERYDLLEADYFAKGDYLELQDLLDPLSSSSSSETSSCVSQSSDVYFDSVALLQELECEDEVFQRKLSCHEFSISKENEMVVSPTAEGTPNRGDNKPTNIVKVEGSTPVLTLKRGLYDENHIPENQKRRPLPVSNDDAGASSSGQRSTADKAKKVARGKMLKKFLCFVAF